MFYKADVSKNRKIYIIFLVVALFVVLFAATMDENKDIESILKHSDEDSLLYFTQSESFHSQDFEIGINTTAAFPKKAVVYYTLDGNNPTTESMKYEGPIKITVSEDISATVFRASIYYKGKFGKIYTKTYFHSKNINQLKDLLLVSIVCDGHDLYDYEEGILVPGRPYDEFFQNNDDAESVPFWRVPANFKLLRGRENEKDAYVEMFSGKGEPIIAQSIGLTLSGGASSYMDVKSFKLVARKEYDAENSKFNYDFYNTTEKAYSEFAILRSYNKLILRNAAQDRERSFIRWNVCSTLATQAGIPCVAPARPAIVFLNGEYYGTTQIQPSYSDYYLSNAFSLEEEFVNVYESQEKFVLRGAGVSKLVSADLTVQKNADALEKSMDIDDMLLYYAFELYINNADWPKNNYKLWKYSGKQVPGNKYSDNRVRPLLYDLDLAFMKTETDNFSLLMDEPEEDIACFSRLMKNDSFKNRFINILNDLMATSLKADNIIKVIDTEAANVDYYEDDPVIGEKVKADLTRSRQRHIDSMKEFVNNRESVMRGYIAEYFNVSDTYTLNIKSPKTGTVKWSSLSLDPGDEDFSGTYYADVPLAITPDIIEGCAFDYWLVNGREVRTENLTITKADIVDGSVNVELIVKRQPKGNRILINEFSAEGGTDWIELYNPYEEAISLKGLYISDDGKNLFKSPLPDVVLEGGSYLIIHCKDSKVLSAFTCSFNIKAGECIYLTASNGTVLDAIGVPKMDSTETYGRLKDKNTFVFFTEPTPGKENIGLNAAH